MGLAALGLGCGEAPFAFEPDPPGRWVKGDLHVHAAGASNDAGEHSTPAAIAAEARARGLDFVVLTDHSNSTGSDPTTRDEDPALFNQGPEFVHWAEAARLSSPGTFLMVSGNELSPVADPPNTPRGHIGCLPGRLDGFDVAAPFVDRPRGVVAGGEALAQARDRGCFTVVNHPFVQVAWLRYDWTDLDYDAIEVFNGGLGFDAADLEAYDAWRCDLLAGRDVVPVGGSDNHRVEVPAPGRFLDSALGWPSTSVFVSELTWPAVVEGLRAGRVMVHDGASRLELDGYDTAGRRASGEGLRWLRVRGALDEGAALARLAVTRAVDCDDPRPASEAPDVTEVEVFARAVRGGATFDERIPIGDEAGVYTARLVVESDEARRGSALSRAVLVR